MRGFSKKCPNSANYKVWNATGYCQWHHLKSWGVIRAIFLLSSSTDSFGVNDIRRCFVLRISSTAFAGNHALGSSMADSTVLDGSTADLGSQFKEEGNAYFKGAPHYGHILLSALLAQLPSLTKPSRRTQNALNLMRQTLLFCATAHSHIWNWKVWNGSPMATFACLPAFGSALTDANAALEIDPNFVKVCLPWHLPHMIRPPT